MKKIATAYIFVFVLLKENETTAFAGNPPHFLNAANGEYPQHENRKEPADGHGKLYSVRPHYRL